MVSWLIIIVGLIYSWIFIDTDSTSGLRNSFAPVVFGILVIVAIIKIVNPWSETNRSNSKNGDCGSFWSGNDSGGDGGWGGGD
ncbi:MAG: hypothetical protein HRU06_08680 [Oceanospirillaceae bacterium]|nr:hypothetical protein [Oceanospirillaceae bacterium]